MPTPDVDYEGELAQTYADGRRLSAEAVATWRDAVAHLVPASAAVVDVGAGTGRYASLLGDATTAPVLAVEPAAAMRRQAGPDGRVQWCAGVAEAIPLRTASAGLVWSAFTTHYLDLPAAGREFRRVLQPGGRVLIWHAFPDVFDRLEWFRWFPAARALDEERMPAASVVQAAFESAGLRFVGRSEHQMLIAPSFEALAVRMAHRSISTLRLIADDDFDAGLDALRAHAASSVDQGPVHAPNVMLEFVSP